MLKAMKKNIMVYMFTKKDLLTYTCSFGKITLFYYININIFIKSRYIEHDSKVDNAYNSYKIKVWIKIQTTITLIRVWVGAARFISCVLNKWTFLTSSSQIASEVFHIITENHTWCVNAWNMSENIVIN